MGKEMMIISIALLLPHFIFNINLVSSSSSSSSSSIEFQGEVVLLLQGAGSVVGGGEKVGEWSAETEMEMDSEVNRRVLWGASGGSRKRYISYGALRRDNVPCNSPGIPYYNCHALPKANPYTRGCSVITGCARGD